MSALPPTAPDVRPASSPGQPVRSARAPRPAARQPVVRHGLLSAIQSLLYIIVVALFIISFVVQPFRIPSESMEPTLLVGDFLLVDKQATAPPSHLHLLPPTAIRRGEIVVFRYPVDPSMHLVKRVIGLPGDQIRLHHGHVIVNGQELTEPYAVYRSRQPDAYRDNFPRLQNADPDVDSRWWIRMRSLVHDGELDIPPGYFFVLGDNRDNSEDSRYWGLVPQATIVGQPLIVYFSLRDRADLPTPSRQHDRESSITTAVVDLARWDRTLHLIR